MSDRSIPSIAFNVEFQDALKNFCDFQTAVNVAVQDDPDFAAHEWAAADQMQTLVAAIDGFIARQSRLYGERSGK